MSVLVTGAAGFLGKALVESLLAAGEEDIRCVVRESNDVSRLRTLAERFPGAHVEIRFGDLTRGEEIRGLLDGVVTVYHLAAASRGAAADLFLNTVVGSKNLLEESRGRQGIRMVLVSSLAVYQTSDLPSVATIDERTPLESHPERRDLYSHSKIRQERLFWEYRKELGFALVVLRPGVIYGPGGTPMSNRVGLKIPGLFLHLGGNNRLPLTFVRNCAEAIVVAGTSLDVDGEVFNVIDDDLPTAKQFLRLYRRQVRKIKYVSVPFWLTEMLSKAVAGYHRRSKGQLPALITPYRTASVWKGREFDNNKIKRLGWSPRVKTEEGLRETFESLRRANGS